MRSRKADLRRRVNGDLALRFTAAGLTSYAGLELLRCYLHRLGFSARLRRHLKAVDPGADYSSVDLVRVLVAMLIVGARRSSHIRYLGADPVIQCFVELRTLSSDRTLSRWLSRCTVLGDHNQQADRPPGALAFHGRPWNPREGDRPTQDRLCLRRDPDDELRRQQHLASPLRARPQPHDELPDRNQRPAPQAKPERTALFLLKSIRTLRYEFLNRAGIVQRPAGRLTLTLSHNTAVKRIFTRLVDKLDQAA